MRAVRWKYVPHQTWFRAAFAHAMSQLRASEREGRVCPRPCYIELRYNYMECRLLHYQLMAGLVSLAGVGNFRIECQDCAFAQ